LRGAARKLARRLALPQRAVLLLMRPAVLSGGLVLGLVGSVAGTRPALADEACTSVEECEKGVQDVEKKAEAPEFDKLRTPDSPAFSVLGVAPSEVERPTSPRAFVLAIGAFVSDSGAELVVPDALAIEASPHSVLSGKSVEHADPGKDERLSPGSLWRNFTFSIATANEDITDPATMETTSKPTMVSVGARTRIWDALNRGKPCEDARG